MKNLFLLIIAIFISLNVYSQINMTDSTVQVVGYWDIDEKFTFTISEEKYKVTELDTTDREFSSYMVDVTVIDSTENSYTVEWFYRDFNFDTSNEVMKKLASISEDMKIIIKTDELGTFQEVVNWKDARKHIKRGMATLKKDYRKIPNMNKVFDQIEELFSTKELIENAAIAEIQQFYTYHGAKYKLSEELKAQIKVPNLYGGEPFDADLVVWLDEINENNNDYIIRMSQTVNSEQLANATYKYLSQMTENLEGPEFDRSTLNNISNIIYTASIIHGTGWPLYSVETKEIKVENTLQFEERIINME